MPRYNLRTRRRPGLADSPPPPATTCTTTNAINALDLEPGDQDQQQLLDRWRQLSRCFYHSFPQQPLPYGESPCSRIIQPLKLAIWAHEEIQGPQLKQLAQLLHGDEATGDHLQRMASCYQTTPAYLCFLFLGSATLTDPTARAFCKASRVYPNISLLAIARSWLERCQTVAVEPKHRRRGVRVGCALRAGLQSLW